MLSLWRKKILGAGQYEVGHPLPVRLAALVLGVLFLMATMMIGAPSAEAKKKKKKRTQAQSISAPLGASLAVSGTLDEVEGTTPVKPEFEGGTFDGYLKDAKVTVKRGGEAFLSGTLQGTATAPSGATEEVNEQFEKAAADVFKQDPNDVVAQEECRILLLDIRPIFLDLLGLQINLSRVTLDITAVSGPGNLLGNLLCAIAGLLD